MTTDPRTILAAAGVSVPEVKEYIARCTWLAENDEMCDSAESIEASADVMALALAREVARQASAHKQAAQALGWVAGQFAVRVQSEAHEHGLNFSDDECAEWADKLIANALARYAEEVGDNADFMAEWQAERRDMARMPEEAGDGD